MTTNETLIEELIEKHISLESYEAVDGRMITMKEAKDDIMVVNVHELKKDLISALQAKERVMVEKFKEIIGEDEKSVAEETGRPFRNEHFETPIKREARNQLRAELRSKLSNLSEK